MPRKLNKASAWANHTLGWEVQKVGSLSDTACSSNMEKKFRVFQVTSVVFGKIRESRNDNAIQSMARTKQEKLLTQVHTRARIYIIINGHTPKLIVWFVY